MTEQDERRRHDEQCAVTQSRLSTGQRAEHRGQTGPRPSLDVDRGRDREHIRERRDADRDQRGSVSPTCPPIWATVHQNGDRRDKQQSKGQEP